MRQHVAVERIVAAELGGLEAKIVLVLVAEARLKDEQSVVPVADARPSVRALLGAIPAREPPQLEWRDVQVERVLRAVLMFAGKLSERKSSNHKPRQIACMNQSSGGLLVYSRQ